MAPPIVQSQARDLTDAEFAELDELLAATPEPLEPVDAVMLDGYLCGTLVQPVMVSGDELMQFVFDFEGRDLPDETDPVWLERTQALILRRHAALNHAMVEDGWFNPLILEFDEEAEAADPAPPLAEGEVDPLAGLSEVSKPLMPWVAGFQHGLQSFPALMELPDDAIDLALARLFRHLPAESDEEKNVVETLDREHPLKDLDAAIEELVVTVADLSDLTRDARYKVDTIRRDEPKLGRNDPCHCGSGKKFKACHGKS
jgi:uncharacterized protein